MNENFSSEYIISSLEKNSSVFKSLFSNLSEDEIRFRQSPEKWCLLEAACHLYDEEREDFRARVKSTLENPSAEWIKINPPEWVTERKYMEQNFEERVLAFLAERKNSIAWLRSLENPNWENAYIHPKVGAVRASLLLSNWLAHDYLHIRQITKLKYDYLKSICGEKLDYAGEW